MASVNKTILLGRVGQQPEQASANAPVSISLATHEVWRDKQGEKKEDLQWHRVAVWGKQGENVMKYVNKGDLIYVEGKLQTDSYEKNGQKMFATKIVAREVKFLTPKGGQQQQSPKPTTQQGNYQQQTPQLPQNSQQQPPTPQAPPPNPHAAYDSMNDIPF